MRARPANSDSSSEEEDANWKAAIESIAATTTFGNHLLAKNSNGSSSHSSSIKKNNNNEEDELTQKPKHYQIKAQKVLDKILEKTLEVVSYPSRIPDDSTVEDSGVRLFKTAPAGIIFDYIEEIQGPKKRPKLVPGYGFDESSKKFRRRTKSIAVDGADIIAAAKEASQKAFARKEAKEAAAQAKAKKEEERVAELKKSRGERWLPSMAKEIQLNKQRTESGK